MCTVTYLPLQDGFILTHNRDEHPRRSESPLEQKTLSKATAVFPRDSEAGGTWIAGASDGRACCLLNGAFVKHERKPPYRKSRGLLLLEALEFKDWFEFTDHIDLDHIEPFTMLFFKPGYHPIEFRWDGSSKYLSNLEQQPHFWCSSTLFPPSMQKTRKQVFSQWLKDHQGPWSPEAVRQLHLDGGVGDPRNNYVMNRDNHVCTISITQIKIQHSLLYLQHLNLISSQVQTSTLET